MLVLQMLSLPLLRRLPLLLMTCGIISLMSWIVRFLLMLSLLSLPRLLVRSLRMRLIAVKMSLLWEMVVRVLTPL